MSFLTFVKVMILVHVLMTKSLLEKSLALTTSSRSIHRAKINFQLAPCQKENQLFRSQLISKNVFHSRQFRKRKMTTSIVASTASSLGSSVATSILSNRIEIPIEVAIKAYTASNVKFVDGSWWLGQPGRNRLDYEVGPRIAGATFLDIDDVADRVTKTELPHMMPPPTLFSLAMDRMNISNNDHVIVYVHDQCPFVHRARYQFGCMGHAWDKVHVLGGSLKDWIDANGPIEDNYVKSFVVSDLNLATSPNYQASVSKNTVTMEEVRDIVLRNDENVFLIDARSPDRFFARVDEPRPGLIRGRMPNAKNVFFYSLLDPSNPSKLKSIPELKEAFTKAEVEIQDSPADKNIRYVATCGSGATACTVATALQLCGVDPNNISIYDGSWMEWGDPKNGNEDLIVST